MAGFGIWWAQVITTSQCTGFVRYKVSVKTAVRPFCASFEPDLGANFTKPYKVNDTMVNQTLELKHGKSLKAFNMDKVSNAPFTQVCFSYH